MRTVPLTAVKDGINRLLMKGGARADSLIELTNGYVNAERKIVVRPGTRRIATIPDTVGLVYFDGKYHVFASTDVPITTTLAQWSLVVANLGAGAFGRTGPGAITTIVQGAITPQGIWDSTLEAGGIMVFNLIGGIDDWLAAYAGCTVTFEAGGGVDVVFTAEEFDDFGAGSSVSVPEADGAPALATIWDAGDVGGTRIVTITGPNPDFELHILLHPFDPDAELERIHYAAPFLGALYVVAEFDDGQIYHYWLQDGEPWAASTEYSANQFATPTTSNGFVYRATRLGSPYPAWIAGAARTLGPPPSIIEPTTYNEFFYTAIALQGDNPSSGTTEPPWPESTGATIVESTDGVTFPDQDAANPPTPPEPNTPQSSTTDRYEL